MTEGFERTASGRLVIRLDELERGVLAALAAQMLALVEPAAADPDADPLEALVGMSSAPVPPPTDPALARLLPDAYREDAEASADFRRFTERGLRETKAVHARAVLDQLERSGDKVTIAGEEADSWLGLLNDLRLTLGTRLGISQDDEPELREGDEARDVYDWLTFVQDSLVRCLLD